MKNILLCITLTLLLLVGCSNGKTNENVNNNEQVPIQEEQNETAIDFKKFFKPADSIAHFLGEGNEFASYTVKTIWLSEKYVATIEDNGGVAKLLIYRVSENKIDKVYDELIEGMPDEVQFPDVTALDELSAIEPYLLGPIEVGTTFGKWTIVEVGLTVETLYETFENVFVIEEVGENYINRKYFVEGFGDIKTEYIMTMDNNEDFVVTSTLESITTE